MIKGSLDRVLAAAGLLIFSPVLVIFITLIWLQDRKSPFYVAPRVGLQGQTFNMVKLRSMIINASQSGVDSTSASDVRITRVGHMVRRYKLDELTQLWNVLKGDMSLVGPRPNVQRETDLYTIEELKLLTIRPGITDLSSIVFADEGEILEDFPDPDLSYNQLIRPWKSRLGIIYVHQNSLVLDIKILWLTLQNVVARKSALKRVARLLQRLGADPEICRVALRIDTLKPTPPPGSSEIVYIRKL